ncbi:MAG: hypothetical protein OEY22_00955 [Candidatus Bathyarchaeota archaeon]|nr:hypothetical protein [Candidatus Bathyarchaeota archaeon]MDH5787751.1 hypothetical protein [Candidatus Bathyarchaeota archaeon]
MKKYCLLGITLALMFLNTEAYVPTFRPKPNPLKVTEPLQTGTITVTGYWWYWFNTTHVLPITNARVEIYDEEATGTVYLGADYTDYNGYFTIGPIVNNDGPGEDGLDIIATVNATSPATRVVTPASVVYSAQTQTFGNRPDGEFYIGNIATQYSQRGAWWIFSYHLGLTRGWYYLSNAVSYNTPQAIARWPYETWPHYHPGGEIHLPDWACWWPSIILHEYGHHVMYSLYGYIPQSMEDHWFTTTSNSTTAWTEGWANFFPLVVYDNPVFTWSNGTHYTDINLETPHWCSAGWDDGDEVEGRVAGALWDVFDSQNDSDPWYYDSFSDGFQRIWNIMHTTPCDTFHEFWQAWNTSGYPKQPALLAMFQNSIDYRGPGDVDANCFVETKDLMLLVQHYGNYKEAPIYPPWDQRRDLNYDDFVDVKDILEGVVNYGNSYDC